MQFHPDIEKIITAFDGVSTAIAERRQPSDVETIEAISGALSGVMIAIGALVRIADALEKIAECADGVYPSAFRVIRQD